MWAKLALVALLSVGGASASAETNADAVNIHARYMMTHAPRSLGGHGGYQDKWLARRHEGCTAPWNGTNLVGAAEGGACRWTVRYGKANRWEDSVAATQEGQDAAQFPSMCPQTRTLKSEQAYSEDCLFMTVYAPSNATAESKLPVFFWVHGGSYVSGSISDAGLDGSVLANEDNMVVVFVQYRLGVLGFLPPASAPNVNDPSFAVRDVILALNGVKENIANFGGDPERVTIGGQSAGASLTRTLLAVPAAKGLFRSAILQSDPINFGTQSFENADGLRTMVFQNETLANFTDFASLQGVDVAHILAVQSEVNSKGPTTVTGVPIGEVFRPQFNTSTLPHDPVSSLFYEPSNLAVDVPTFPVLMTYTRNESGYIIDSFISGAQPYNEFIFNVAINQVLGAERGKAFIAANPYAPNNGSDGMRTGMEIVITDAVWRCVSQAVGHAYAAAGGKLYLGEWTEGVQYAINTAPEGYCATGAVCHADDIYSTFDSAPNATANANATALAADVRPLWKAFIYDQNPGSNWTVFSANSTTDAIYNIGDEHAITACPADFWGNVVKWDWQLFSNQTNGTVSAGAAASSTPAGGEKSAAATAARPNSVTAAAVAGLAVVLGAVAVAL